MTFKHSMVFLTLLAASAIAQPNPADHGGRSTNRDGLTTTGAEATNVSTAQTGKASSANNERIAALLLRMATATTSGQTEALVAELARFEELDNQAFSIKGDAAIVGDDYYILVNGPRNRVLDTRRGAEWSGKSRDDLEAVFINNTRGQTIPRSTEEVSAAWVFVFARDKAYYLNVKRDTFGYYAREPWRESQ